MKLTFSQAVIDKLMSKNSADAILLLDNEDGDGPFVDYAVSCQLRVGFRVLIVPKEYEQSYFQVYTTQLATSLGPIYLKPSALLFLDQENELVIEPSYQRIQLRSNSGIIDSNVTIEQLSSEGVTRWGN